MAKDLSSNETPMRLPQVDLVLRQAILIDLSKTVRREILAQLIREELDVYRRQTMKGSSPSSAENARAPSAQEVAEKVAHTASELLKGGVRRVINGTGVILNTNLGRAPLPPTVLSRLFEMAQGYTSLEIDIDTGKRGERTSMVSRLMSLLIGSQSAIVVNNNASAVMLAVSSLAHGKEVIVSRGELIEIGGAFRLPDVITKAGGVLKEVGTTNRTRTADYANAVSENTGCLLRCHRSNFEITGFTEEPELSQLVALAQKTKVPLVEDLGSGAFFDVATLGLAYEPTVDRVILTGVDLVMFSGDKLLGGPQAGIIAGRKELVERLRKNPMYRALRADKLIIALIEIVLAQYLSPDAHKLVPVISLASLSVDELKTRVETFIDSLSAECTTGALYYKAIPCQSALGGGSLPGKTLVSYALQLSAKSGISAEKLSTLLRKSDPPVVSVIHEDKVLIDFRTVLERDFIDLMASLKRISQELS